MSTGINSNTGARKVVLGDRKEISQEIFDGGSLHVVFDVRKLRIGPLTYDIDD